MANSALSLHGPIGVQDNRNELINGDFNIWQRGITTSVGVTGKASTTCLQNSFVADRWRIYSQAVNGVTAPPLSLFRTKMPLGYPAGADRASKWYLNIHVGPTASTGAAHMGHNNVGGFTGAGATTDGSFAALVQDIDDVGTLEGKTCIISFWAKSDISNQRVAPVLKQCFAGGTAATLLIAGSTGHLGHTLDNTWRQYKTSFNVPSIQGQPLDGPGALEFGSSGDDALQVQLILHANSGKAGTGVTFELGGPGHAGKTGNISFSQIQIEQGSRSTEFDKTNPMTEVALCQRYYEKSYNLDDAPGTNTNRGAIGLSDPSINPTCHQNTYYSTRKRATLPTVVLYDIAGTPGNIYVRHAQNHNNTNIVGNAGWISESGFGRVDVESTHHLGTYSGGDTLINFQYTADAELSVDTD